MTPELPEGQERSEGPATGYFYVNRDIGVHRTVEISGSINVDVDASACVYGVEVVGAMGWMDVFLEVLRVLPQKIHEAAYRAGREDAVRQAREELPAALAQAVRNLGEELGRESLSGPEMLQMIVELADMIERDVAIDLGRLAGHDGDNTP